MSGLETIIPLIYHEKQQSGSQLCAQHALNAILQGDYFSAPDLAQFAHQLDTLEGSFNDDAGPVSNNMDDTGFFSVQVLEGALRVWGLTLVRWRSQDLRDQQESPHSQMAFVLNHQQHWFTLRRFGSLHNPESGHWFNLNSFLREPEWVGKLYLSMVLSQAEDEGYSVFAVLPVSEGDALRTLPRTEADDVASTLPEPTSSNMGARLSTSNTFQSANADPSSSTSPRHPSGFEDEDLELQAALQASLTGAGQLNYPTFPQRTYETHSTSSLPTPPTGTPAFSEVPPAPVDDPLAASMARNKVIMRRMLQHQEIALRERYDEEVAIGFGPANGIEMHRSGEPSQGHEARTAGELEEEEAIRRAIEESRADGSASDDDQEAMEVTDADWLPRQHGVPPSHPTASGDRVYDDEDSQLQAALKASLEGLPEGFVVPPSPPRASVSVIHPSVPSEGVTLEKDDIEEEEEKPTMEIDAAEMRRRRLARFGGQ